DDHGEDDHGEDDHGEDDHGEDDHGEDDHGEDDHGEDDHGEDDHGEDDHGEDDHGEDDHGHDDHGSAEVYETSEVALRVNSRSATLVPNNPAFGFLGQPGKLIYELPQHEEEGLLFLGIASDEVEEGAFVGDQVQLNLKSVEGPGEIYLYSTDNFGKPSIMFNTADGINESDTFLIKAGAHSHQSMAFSEAGTYRIGFDFSGKLAATGEETRSDEFELLFEVEKVTPNDLIIDSFSNSAAPFSISFKTKSGSNYIIEASHNLREWGEIGEVQGTGSSVKFTERRKAFFPKQYYRVKLQE
ncbi:MAG: choice-of-anchor M domain-containing protein, partial [Verrucomicrobiota bacterium]|nr:choice-of-anchor M domain-containing protein [Verrucomicrobiota bacterium]